MEPREFLDILHVAERLKNTIRHCTTSDGRPESVAEHSWRIALMAFLLRDEFKDIDMDKVIRMCLIHDLGESFTGDIPVFLKTESDSENEDALLHEWVTALPKGPAEEMLQLYEEMNQLQSKEAKIYKAFDKLEAVIQHNESPIATWEDHEYELQKRYAWDAVDFSDWLKRLREEVYQDTIEKIEKEK